MEPKTRASGFASMDQHKQREIARKGGMAAHQKGTAHEFTAEEARDAGRKGGQQVSANRSHMIEIGRLGGKRSAERRRRKAAENGLPLSRSVEEVSAASKSSHADEASRKPQVSTLDRETEESQVMAGQSDELRQMHSGLNDLTGALAQVPQPSHET